MRLNHRGAREPVCEGLTIGSVWIFYSFLFFPNCALGEEAYAPRESTAGKE